MSMNQVCECGNESPIRFNFGGNIEAETNFHSQKYICNECKKHENIIASEYVDENTGEAPDPDKLEYSLLFMRLAKLMEEFPTAFGLIQKFSKIEKESGQEMSFLIMIKTINNTDEMDLMFMQQPLKKILYILDKLTDNEYSTPETLDDFVTTATLDKMLNDKLRELNEF